MGIWSVESEHCTINTPCTELATKDDGLNTSYWWYYDNNQWMMWSVEIRKRTNDGKQIMTV